MNGPIASISVCGTVANDPEVVQVGNTQRARVQLAEIPCIEPGNFKQKRRGTMKVDLSLKGNQAAPSRGTPIYIIGATYQIDLWDGSEDGQQRRFHNLYAYHWRVLTLQAQAGTPAASSASLPPTAQSLPVAEGEPLPKVVETPGGDIRTLPTERPPVPTPVPAPVLEDDDDDDVPF
jgi:hypothetical protein